MSSDKEDDYLSDGLTEELINALARVPGLRVPARTSAFAFKGKQEDIRKAGELLRVSTVLEGSVRRAGNRLRITAQLINVDDGYHIWSEQFERELKDVFAVQDEITRVIVAKLKGTLAAGADVSGSRHRPANIEAYELYLKARFHTFGYTEESLKQAIRCYQQALEKQPDYAPAYAGLAYVYDVLWYFGFMPPKLAYQHSALSLTKALELDPALIEAQAIQAGRAFFADWDFVTGETRLRELLQRDPLNVDARYYHGEMLQVLNRVPTALASNAAAQNLDPLSVVLKVQEGWIHAMGRDYARALEAGLKAGQLDSNYFTVHDLIGFALFSTGRKTEGIAEAELGVRLGKAPLSMGNLGFLYGRANRKTDADRVLRDLERMGMERYVPANCLALVCIGLGDFDKADFWVNKAIEGREPNLRYFRCFAGDLVRGSPHFKEWFKKMGLSP